jgi:two-component system sensor histidine kinase/response regulator
LLDWSMPDMGGLALSNAIAIDRTLRTPVILMTGLHKDRNLGSTVPGVAATLSKPVHRKELHTCVRVALGLHVDELATTVGDPFLATQPAMASGRILLAEDNLINQKVAVAMLSGAGYQVDTVPDGIAAVQAVATQRYDAILMDCQLPGLSGYEATAEIRAKEGSDRHTPIIAMTAGARREDRERCLAQGMDSYLSKPVSRETLLDLVGSSIKTSNATSTEGEQTGGHWASGNEVILDPGVFGRLRYLENTSGRGFLNNLISQFVSSTDMYLRELHSALDVGDGRAVGRIAQTIKEDSARLSGRRLALACGQLERKTLSESLADSQSDLDEVEADYDDLRFALLQELATSGRREAVG